MFNQDSALQFLRNAHVFYSNTPDPEEPEAAQTLNMNDTWGWALAWGEKVPDEELVRVAELVWEYGRAGCLYWVSERHEQMRSEFHDVNRRVEFVRYEEEFKKRTPGSSKRAYTPFSYTLGDTSDEPESTGEGPATGTGARWMATLARFGRRCVGGT